MMTTTPPGQARAHHVPVLLTETLDALAVRPGGTYLDATLGGAGHAAAILSLSAPDGRLLGIDRDALAVARAAERLAPFGTRATLIDGAFGDLDRIADDAGFAHFDGVLLDLGISSDQLDDPRRGLSFQASGPLDMRLDARSGDTAAELIETLTEEELADLVYTLGEERASRRIARAIVAARPIATTDELAEIILRAVGRPHGRGGRIHPATRTFQALRMAVNDELGQIAAALPKATALLATGGRLAVISFHSLEDRLVKRTLRALAGEPPPDAPPFGPAPIALLRLVGRKAIQPGDDESASNPRARSARLRVAERLATSGGAA